MFFVKLGDCHSRFTCSNSQIMEMLMHTIERWMELQNIGGDKQQTNADASLRSGGSHARRRVLSEAMVGCDATRRP